MELPDHLHQLHNIDILLAVGAEAAGFLLDQPKDLVVLVDQEEGVLGPICLQSPHQ